MKAFLWAGCLSYFLIGLAHVIAGSLLPELLAHYGLDYSAGGRLIALQFLGFLIGVLAGPFCTSRLGQKGALLLCLLCLGTAELTLFALPPWSLVLTVAPVAGFGFGMIETVIGAIALQTFEEGRKATVMARLEVFFGVGALVMPMLSSLWIAGGYWRGAFLTLSALAWLVFLLWIMLPMGDMKRQLSDSRRLGAETGAVALRSGTRLMLGLCIAIFLLYVGTEMSLANFLPSILLEQLSVKPELGALSVTCFWGAMSIGRLFAAAAAQRIGYPAYMMTCCGGAVVIISAFAAGPGLVLSFILIGLLGVILSGMFAISLVYATSFFPGREERTTSILIASGGVGGALLPLATGRWMDLFSTAFALWGLAVLALLLFALVWVASRLGGRLRQAASDAKAEARGA